MVGIQKLDITQREFDAFKRWVRNTTNENLQQHFSSYIKQKLKSLRKQEGRCDQRSLCLTKGKYKGSCTWSGEKKAYEIWIRWENEHRNVTYGFFPNLYSAEHELKMLFEEKEDGLIDKAVEQQKYYRIQNRLTKHPKLTDNTLNICQVWNNSGGMELYFNKPFINPITSKQQKCVTWAKSWFKYFDKQQIIKECVRLDDPVEIILYKEQLKQILKEQKQKEKQQREKRVE